METNNTAPIEDYIVDILNRVAALVYTDMKQAQTELKAVIAIMERHIPQTQVEPMPHTTTKALLKLYPQDASNVCNCDKCVFFYKNGFSDNEIIAHLRRGISHKYTDEEVSSFLQHYATHIVTVK